MAQRPAFVLPVRLESLRMVGARRTFDPPAVASHTHHSTTPSERPMYRLFPYPSTHLTSIFWSTGPRLRLSPGPARSGDKVPLIPVTCVPDGEAVPVAIPAALRPAAAAIDVAEEKMEAAAGCGEELVLGGEEGPGK